MNKTQKYISTLNEKLNGGLKKDEMNTFVADGTLWCNPNNVNLVRTYIEDGVVKEYTLYPIKRDPERNIEYHPIPDTMSPIRYTDEEFEKLNPHAQVAVEEDGDEIFYFNGNCHRWECQEGFDENDKPIYPSLLATWHEDDGKAFWECPKCHYSYGPVNSDD